SSGSAAQASALPTRPWLRSARASPAARTSAGTARESGAPASTAFASASTTLSTPSGGVADSLSSHSFQSGITVREPAETSEGIRPPFDVGRLRAVHLLRCGRVGEVGLGREADDLDLVHVLRVDPLQLLGE